MGPRRDWRLHQSTNEGEYQQQQKEHSMWESSTSSSRVGRGQLVSSVRTMSSSKRAEQRTQSRGGEGWYMSRSTRHDSRQTAAARLNQAGG